MVLLKYEVDSNIFFITQVPYSILERGQNLCKSHYLLCIVHLLSLIEDKAMNKTWSVPSKSSQFKRTVNKCLNITRKVRDVKTANT